jgi:hypothetical protein
VVSHTRHRIPRFLVQGWVPRGHAFCPAVRVSCVDRGRTERPSAERAGPVRQARSGAVTRCRPGGTRRARTHASPPCEQESWRTAKPDTDHRLGALPNKVARVAPSGQASFVIANKTAWGRLGPARVIVSPWRTRGQCSGVHGPKMVSVVGPLRLEMPAPAHANRSSVAIVATCVALSGAYLPLVIVPMLVITA